MAISPSPPPPTVPAIAEYPKIVPREIVAPTIRDVLASTRKAVLTDIDRGVTMLKSETGYMERETEMLLTVVSIQELAKTEKLIHSVDEDAFVVINRVSEVSGRGFSSKKRYLEKENS